MAFRAAGYPEKGCPRAGRRNRLEMREHQAAEHQDASGASMPSDVPVPPCSSTVRAPCLAMCKARHPPRCKRQVSARLDMIAIKASSRACSSETPLRRAARSAGKPPFMICGNPFSASPLAPRTPNVRNINFSRDPFLKEIQMFGPADAGDQKMKIVNLIRIHPRQSTR